MDGRRVCDVRGWPVRTLVDGHHAGTVHDLLLDERGVPRYLDLRLLTDARHVLLPIGQARADRGREVVWVPGFIEDGFASIPRYDHSPERLSRADEASLVAAYRAAYD
ncbi:MAG: PRC-barrel domain-containing protein, partial [Gemmatimonadota bacterium]